MTKNAGNEGIDGRCPEGVPASGRLSDEVLSRMDPWPRVATVSVPAEWMRSLLAEVREHRAREAVGAQPDPKTVEPPKARCCKTCRHWDALSIDQIKGDCRAPGDHRYWRMPMPDGGHALLDSFERETTRHDFVCDAWRGGDDDE